MNNVKENKVSRYNSLNLNRKHELINELYHKYEYVFEEMREFIKEKMSSRDLTIREFYRTSGISDTIIREFLTLNPIKTKVKNFVLILDALDVKLYEIELSKTGPGLILGKTNLDDFLNDKETYKTLKRKSRFNSFYWLRNKIIPSNFCNSTIDSLVMFLHFIGTKKVTLDVEFLKGFYTEIGGYNGKNKK